MLAIIKPTPTTYRQRQTRKDRTQEFLNVPIRMPAECPRAIPVDVIAI